MYNGNVSNLEGHLNRRKMQGRQDPNAKKEMDGKAEEKENITEHGLYCEDNTEAINAGEDWPDETPDPSAPHNNNKQLNQREHSDDGNFNPKELSWNEHFNRKDPPSNDLKQSEFPGSEVLLTSSNAALKARARRHSSGKRLEGDDRVRRSSGSARIFALSMKQACTTQKPRRTASDSARENSTKSPTDKEVTDSPFKSPTEEQQNPPEGAVDKDTKKKSLTSISEKESQRESAKSPFEIEPEHDQLKAPTEKDSYNNAKRTESLSDSKPFAKSKDNPHPSKKTGNIETQILEGNTGAHGHIEHQKSKNASSEIKKETTENEAKNELDNQARRRRHTTCSDLKEKDQYSRGSRHKSDGSMSSSVDDPPRQQRRIRKKRKSNEFRNKLRLNVSSESKESSCYEGDSRGRDMRSSQGLHHENSTHTTSSVSKQSCHDSNRTHRAGNNARNVDTSREENYNGTIRRRRHTTNTKSQEKDKHVNQHRLKSDGSMPSKEEIKLEQARSDRDARAVTNSVYSKPYAYEVPPRFRNKGLTPAPSKPTQILKNSNQRDQVKDLHRYSSTSVPVCNKPKPNGSTNESFVPSVDSENWENECIDVFSPSNQTTDPPKKCVDVEPETLDISTLNLGSPPKVVYDAKCFSTNSVKSETEQLSHKSEIRSNENYCESECLDISNDRMYVEETSKNTCYRPKCDTSADWESECIDVIGPSNNICSEANVDNNVNKSTLKGKIFCDLLPSNTLDYNQNYESKIKAEHSSNRNSDALRSSTHNTTMLSREVTSNDKRNVYKPPDPLIKRQITPLHDIKCDEETKTRLRDSANKILNASIDSTSVWNKTQQRKSKNSISKSCIDLRTTQNETTHIMNNCPENRTSINSDLKEMNDNWKHGSSSALVSKTAKTVMDSVIEKAKNITVIAKDITTPSLKNQSLNDSSEEWNTDHFDIDVSQQNTQLLSDYFSKMNVNNGLPRDSGDMKTVERKDKCTDRAVEHEKHSSNLQATTLDINGNKNDNSDQNDKSGPPSSVNASHIDKHSVDQGADTKSSISVVKEFGGESETQAGESSIKKCKSRVPNLDKCVNTNSPDVLSKTRRGPLEKAGTESEIDESIITDDDTGFMCSDDFYEKSDSEQSNMSFMKANINMKVYESCKLAEAMYNMESALPDEYIPIMPPCFQTSVLPHFKESELISNSEIKQEHSTLKPDRFKCSATQEVTMRAGSEIQSPIEVKPELFQHKSTEETNCPFPKSDDPFERCTRSVPPGFAPLTEGCDLSEIDDFIEPIEFQRDTRSAPPCPETFSLIGDDEHSMYAPEEILKQFKELDYQRALGCVKQDPENTDQPSQTPDNYEHSKHVMIKESTRSPMKHTEQQDTYAIGGGSPVQPSRKPEQFRQYSHEEYYNQFNEPYYHAMFMHYMYMMHGPSPPYTPDSNMYEGTRNFSSRDYSPRLRSKSDHDFKTNSSFYSPEKNRGNKHRQSPSKTSKYSPESFTGIHPPPRFQQNQPEYPCSTNTSDSGLYETNFNCPPGCNCHICDAYARYAHYQQTSGQAKIQDYHTFNHRPGSSIYEPSRTYKASVDHRTSLRKSYSDPISPKASPQKDYYHLPSYEREREIATSSNASSHKDLYGYNYKRERDSPSRSSSIQAFRVTESSHYEGSHYLHSYSHGDVAYTDHAPHSSLSGFRGPSGKRFLRGRPFQPYYTHGDFKRPQPQVYDDFKRGLHPPSYEHVSQDRSYDMQDNSSNSTGSPTKYPSGCSPHKQISPGRLPQYLHGPPKVNFHTNYNTYNRDGVSETPVLADERNKDNLFEPIVSSEDEFMTARENVDCDSDKLCANTPLPETTTSKTGDIETKDMFKDIETRHMTSRTNSPRPVPAFPQKFMDENTELFQNSENKSVKPSPKKSPPFHQEFIEKNAELFKNGEINTNEKPTNEFVSQNADELSGETDTSSNDLLDAVHSQSPDEQSANDSVSYDVGEIPLPYGEPLNKQRNWTPSPYTRSSQNGRLEESAHSNWENSLLYVPGFTPAHSRYVNTPTKMSRAHIQSPVYTDDHSSRYHGNRRLSTGLSTIASYSSSSDDSNPLDDTHDNKRYKYDEKENQHNANQHGRQSPIESSHVLSCINNKQTLSSTPVGKSVSVSTCSSGRITPSMSKMSVMTADNVQYDNTNSSGYNHTSGPSKVAPSSITQSSTGWNYTRNAEYNYASSSKVTPSTNSQSYPQQMGSAETRLCYSATFGDGNSGDSDQTKSIKPVSFRVRNSSSSIKQSPRVRLHTKWNENGEPKVTNSNLSDGEIEDSDEEVPDSWYDVDDKDWDKKFEKEKKEREEKLAKQRRMSDQTTPNFAITPNQFWALGALGSEEIDLTGNEKKPFGRGAVALSKLQHGSSVGRGYAPSPNTYKSALLQSKRAIGRGISLDQITKPSQSSTFGGILPRDSLRGLLPTPGQRGMYTFQPNATRNSPLDAVQWERWDEKFKKIYAGLTTPYIDTHCHLDFLFDRLQFKGSFAKYIEENRASFPANFGGCVAVFCNPNTFNVDGGLWRDVLEEPNVWAAIGCHPKKAQFFDHRAEVHLAGMVRHKKVMAVGEIGLDYSQDFKQYEHRQKEVLGKHCALAQEVNKPIVIHSRDAEEDTLKTLGEFVPSDYKIHRHCFTGNWAECSEWLRRFPESYVGLTPLVTWANDRAWPVKEVARNIPLDKLILETDAPYFLPKGIPREVNYSHPGMAISVAREVAYQRCMNIEQVLQVCLENSKKMYGINI